MLRHILLSVVVLGHSAVLGEDPCGPCEPGACESPRNCLAGLVKDPCDCCYLCGNREGVRCDHQSLPYTNLGICGENLECRVRSDLDFDDPPEAVCVCKRQKPICGSDGKTYDNICQLTEARYSRRDGLRAVSSDPCIQSPRIVSPPSNIRNVTGSSASLACEAKGWPLPSIHWQKTQEENRILVPEKNSTRLAERSRSGPHVDEITSWLLFMNLSEEDRGTYICTAENGLGATSESATVTVFNKYTK